MSFERTIPPIVSDAICFHNEDRIKMNHPFARQPQSSMIGLPPSYLFYEKSNKADENSTKAVTKLHTEKYGYSHTAALGVPRQTCIDPKYNLPKCGSNERAQVLNYYRRNTNLLFR